MKRFFTGLLLLGVLGQTVLFATPVEAATCYASTTPSSFTYSTAGAHAPTVFTDGGTVSGARRINFTSPSQSNSDRADLTFTVTGLTSGVAYTFAASSTENAGGVAMGDSRILVDGVQIASVGTSPGTTNAPMGIATTSTTSATLVLRLAAQDLGGGISHTEDWTNVLVYASDCNPTPPSPAPATTSTTTITYESPTQDVFYLWVIFFVSFVFVVWSFKKR